MYVKIGVLQYEEIYTFIHIYKLVMLAILVEDDPKVSFSIATTPTRCRGGQYSIPRIAPLYP